MRVAARAYTGRTFLLRTVGNLQVTPVLMQDGRYLQEVTVSKKTAGPARQPTVLRSLQKTDAVDGHPYPPERDGWEHYPQDGRTAPLPTLGVGSKISHYKFWQDIG